MVSLDRYLTTLGVVHKMFRAGALNILLCYACLTYPKHKLRYLGCLSLPIIQQHVDDHPRIAMQLTKHLQREQVHNRPGVRFA